MGLLKFIFSKRFLKHIVGAILLTIVLLIGIFFWLNYYTNHNEYIKVPDLSKLSIDIVEKKLDEMSLTYTIKDSTAYNPEYPPFSVVDQDPKPDQFVKENRKIYITVNPSDFVGVKIPDGLIGKTIRQVRPTLQSLGFIIGEITEKPDLAKNVVLELKYRDKKLSVGDMLKKTSVIDLVVGDGTLKYGESAPQKSARNE